MDFHVAAAAERRGGQLLKVGETAGTKWFATVVFYFLLVGHVQYSVAKFV